MTIEQVERIIADCWAGLQARHLAEEQAFAKWTREIRREAYTQAVEGQRNEG